MQILHEPATSSSTERARRVGCDVLKQEAFDVALGSWLAERRERRGVSQDALAIQLGRDQAFVSRTESGQRRITARDLVAWLAALGDDLSDLGVELRGIARLADSRSLWEDE